MDRTKRYLVKFLPGEHSEPRADRWLDGGADGKPDVRPCYAGRKSRIPTIGSWYWVRIVADGVTKWYCECEEQCPAPTKVNLGHRQPLAVLLPDGERAAEGYHYSQWLEGRDSPEVVVAVPIAIEVWVLVQWTSYPDRGRPVECLRVEGVNVLGNKEPRTSHFGDSGYNQKLEPEHSRGVPGQVYLAGLDLASAAVKEHWASEARRLALAKNAQALAAARFAAQSVQNSAKVLRARCLGISVKAAALRVQLTEFADASLPDDVPVLHAWVSANRGKVEALVAEVAVVEKAELDPVLALQTGKGGDKELARAAYGRARSALASGNGDATGAIKQLKRMLEGNKGTKLGNEVALAIAFLQTQVAGSSASGSATPTSPADPPSSK